MEQQHQKIPRARPVQRLNDRVILGLCNADRVFSGAQPDQFGFQDGGQFAFGASAQLGFQLFHDHPIGAGGPDGAGQFARVLVAAIPRLTQQKQASLGRNIGDRAGERSPRRWGLWDKIDEDLNAADFHEIAATGVFVGRALKSGQTRGHC